MGNVAWRHKHQCPGCGRVWECFLPGGCREEAEKECQFCEEEDDGEGEEDEE